MNRSKISVEGVPPHDIASNPQQGSQRVHWVFAFDALGDLALYPRGLHSRGLRLILLLRNFALACSASFTLS
jgi:hypothetical protein